MLEFRFNVTRNGEPCDQVARFDAPMLSVEGQNYDISKVSDINLRESFGVLSLELEADGHTDVLMCATMDRKEELADFTQALRYYNTHGIVEENPKKLYTRICPKCGRAIKSTSGLCFHCVSKTGILKRFLHLLKPHTGAITGSIIFFILGTALSMLSPQVSRIMVDEYVNNETMSRIFAGGNAEAMAVVVGGLLSAVAAYFLIDIFYRIFAVIRSNILQNAAVDVAVKLRDDAFGKIQRLSLAKITERTVGELMQTVRRDTMEVQNFLVHQLPNLVMQSLLIVCASIIMLLYDWRLFLLVVAPMPVAVLMMVFVRRVLSKYAHRSREANSEASSVLYDIISGIRVVKAYGTEARETERYSKSADRERIASTRSAVFNSWMSPIASFIMKFGSYFVLWYVGNQIIGGGMTIGQLTMFNVYTAIMYAPLSWFSNLPGVLANTFTSMARLFDVLDEREEIADNDKCRKMSIRGEIKFENVTFGYNPSQDVLKNVSFDIKPGEMIGLVGKSGVGKSTLTNLVMRLYEVENGAIYIDGVNIKDIALESLKSQIGVVLQETFLFSGSVLDNLLYVKPTASRDEIIAACKIAGAHRFIIKLPYGYNTLLGERGYTLSGGERQRLAIARALLVDPRILILDEATSSLDTETEHDIQEALAKLVRSRTTIAIAHRLSTLRNSNRIVVLDDKKIAEIGTHEELLKKRGIYYNLVMAQRNMNTISKQ